MRLAGRTAIVTGGTSGIGRATARLFVREGAAVVVTGRDPGRGAEVEAELGAGGGRARFVAGDVREAEDCRRVVEETLATFGTLDVLFNNAGVIFRERTVPETPEEEWDLTMDTNLRGVYLMSRYAIPPMAEGGGGSIVNNASYLGLVATRGLAAYCASKGGVVLLTKAMALDHAHQRIRVNCVCPGSVDTPMLRGEMEELGGVEAARGGFEAKHPLGRIADPEEVARAVCYLASDESSFITGAALPVDGGLTAG